MTLALGAWGAVLLMGQVQAPAPGAAQPQSQGRVIEAEKFIVRDATGRERAVLGLDHPVSPGHSPVRLGLYNEGDSTAVLYLSDGFAGLSISSGGGGEAKRSVQLFANPREGGGLKLAAGPRKDTVRLGADREGKAYVTLADDAGKVVFKAP
jgi:hypothetical protein